MRAGTEVVTRAASWKGAGSNGSLALVLVPLLVLALVLVPALVLALAPVLFCSVRRRRSSAVTPT